MATVTFDRVRKYNSKYGYGFCEMTIDDITIRDCQIRKKSDGTFWVAVPERSYVADDGAKKYSKYVMFPRSIGDDVQAAAEADPAIMAVVGGEEPEDDVPPDDDIPF